MKILHTSDIHLDSALTSRLPPHKAKERRAELFSTLNRLLVEAEKQGCGAVIIAGDLFDRDRISRRMAERAMSYIAKHPTVDVLYLPGNHERLALTDCGAVLPENLRVFGSEWTYFDYPEVRIGGAERIDESTISSFRGRKDAICIGVLHGSPGNRSDSNGVIGIPELDRSDIDYLALGHYHGYGEHRTPGGKVAVYCGTPEGRGFDEVGLKGYVMIEVSEGHLHHRFVPFAYRTLHAPGVDISDANTHSDIALAVDQALSAVSERDLVSLRLVGRRSPELRVDCEELLISHRDSYYYFEVRDESRLRIDMSDYILDKSLKGEFIRLALGDKELSEEDRDTVIRMGLSALMGEEGDI